MGFTLIRGAADIHNIATPLYEAQILVEGNGCHVLLIYIEHGRHQPLVSQVAKSGDSHGAAQSLTKQGWINAHP